jgi:hypothetical protein
MAKKEQVFDVDVCRIGYGHRTLRIRAADAKKAVEQALDVAGNFEYSEKESKYEADSASPSSDQTGEVDSDCEDISNAAYMAEEMTVRVSTPECEEFYVIKRSDALRILAAKTDRFTMFYKAATPTKLTNDETALHIDNSGNQTEEEFWQSEGEEEWKDALS